MITGGTMNRSIFFELIKIFSIAISGLTGLFLVGLVIQQASQMGLSLWQTVSVIPMLIPSTLPYTIPATTLFSTCVVYGRIAHDNEAVAVKAAGIDILTIMRPAALLGVLTALVTAGISYAIIPRTHVQLQEYVLQNPEDVLYNMLKKERSFRAAGSPYVLFVKDVQNHRLIDVVFKRKKKGDPTDLNPGYDFIARAREATLRVDLVKGVIAIRPDRLVAVGDGTVVNANGQDEIEVPLPSNMTTAEVKTRPSAIDWNQLPRRAAELQRERDSLIARFEEVRVISIQQKDPSMYNKQEPLFKGGIAYKNRELQNVLCEYHMRPALAFGCFCFALIGCPVGLRASRADYLSVFVICFLPTIFTYYPLVLAGSNAARDGKLPVPVGVWLANAIALLVAFILARRFVRR